MDGVHTFHQKEVLKHKADAVRPQPGDPPVIERAEVDTVDRDTTRRRTVETAHDVQKRRFARPAGSNNRDKLTTADNQVDGI